MGHNIWHNIWTKSSVGIENQVISEYGSKTRCKSTVDKDKLICTWIGRWCQTEVLGSSVTIQTFIWAKLARSFLLLYDMIWCTSHERMLFKTKMKYYSHIGRRRGESTLIVHHDTIDGNCDRRRKRPKKQMTQTMRKLNIYQRVYSSKLHHTSCMRFIHRKIS